MVSSNHYSKCQFFFFSIFATSCVLEWKLQGAPSYLLVKTRKNYLILSCVRFCILCASSKLLTVELVRHGWGFFFLGKGILGKKGRRKEEECSLLWDMNDSVCFCYFCLHFSSGFLFCFWYGRHIGCICFKVLYCDIYTVLVLSFPL